MQTKDKSALEQIILRVIEFITGFKKDIRLSAKKAIGIVTLLSSATGSIKRNTPKADGIKNNSRFRLVFKFLSSFILSPS